MEQRRAWMVLIQGLMILAVASCGGNAAAPADEDRGEDVATVTLSHGGCSYDGPREISSDRLALELVNRTDVEGQFDLWRLAGQHSFEEFSAHVGGELAMIEAGKMPEGPPAYAVLVARMTASAGSTSQEEVSLNEAGLHAFACVSFDTQAGTPRAIYAAGPIEPPG
jgi:hypothetical protein